MIQQKFHKIAHQFDVAVMGLLPDTKICRLRLRPEWREHFPRHRLQRKPVVNDLGIHRGTCVTHVPWCMPGSLTCGAFPAHVHPAISRIWQEAHAPWNYGLTTELRAIHYLNQRVQFSRYSGFLLKGMEDAPLHRSKLSVIDVEGLHEAFTERLSWIHRIATQVRGRKWKDI